MRRSRPLFAIHFATSLAIALATSASATQNLSLAHNFAPGSLPDRTAVKFAELTANKSRQALRIVVQRGALGEEGDNIARLRRGQLDCALSDTPRSAITATTPAFSACLFSTAARNMR